ncbi:MAG: hypothetical protein COW00_01625 [Bdellovibrio sp. CG12_big_fil_rev_8_21_14_0_65_39_13]|nr:MAG: hypothetical protein COW78_03375 [Bdellovibrio sp. CG22_combo_CG10-13_8_21_14_all_39_27]PIQ62409.1 MAG: hypothetical protein COW00_01625 [Bdellovibrio sp. CG12_big_fil_rev_8_21_14_0_65_39_13]PIR34076.1 MAG: hypothetical protein COV37_14105 [Bdellovibrio sp. CG11_big_fil_rev_8_21_14_0_20_39_38]PJB52970.1 MAG: hypothetical protein CO099_09700 [Bdellovibrio sp. CG_4_9_14_3_um_filter_39_7]
MSYEFYKVLHLAMIFIFIGSAAFQFASTTAQKSVKIATGVTSFLILVGGMGLLARIGISHGAGFPGWVWAKMAIWLVIAAATPILGKRLVNNRGMALVGIIGLMIMAAYLAVNKPF